MWTKAKGNPVTQESLERLQSKLDELEQKIKILEKKRSPNKDTKNDD